MMEEEEIKKFEAELERAKQEAYAKEKAKSETNAIVDISQDTNKTLQSKLNSKLAHHIDNDELVSTKIEETAGKLVEQGLKVQEKKVNKELKTAEKEENQAEFELSEDQYRAFGQDTAPKKNWQKKLIEYCYDFWFCIITMICFMSLAPFYIFVKVIETQKGVLKFVACLIGIIMLLVCLGGLTYLVLKICNVPNI